MATYSANFLSRDDRGRFKRKSMTIPAEDHAEVLAWINHGWEHGKWALEGDIEVRGPVGWPACETVTYPCS